MRYDAKISTIEDRPELEKLTVDELHGIINAYEMRTRKEKTSKGETTFKNIPHQYPLFDDDKYHNTWRLLIGVRRKVFGVQWRRVVITLWNQSIESKYSSSIPFILC